MCECFDSSVCVGGGVCNVWMCVYVGFVVCGCFGNMCTCIYCVLYCLYCVFVLFRLCVFILICFVCTSVRTTATELKLNCSSSSSNNNNNNNNNVLCSNRDTYCLCLF
jgi:hypothetical protein